MVFVIDLVGLVHLVQYQYVALVQHINHFRYDALAALQNFNELIFLHRPKRLIKGKDDCRLVLRE